MGADYRAYAVLGVQVDPERLEKLASCDHDKPPKAKFCPECGKPSGTYDREEGSNGKVCGYDVIWSTDEREAFIGIVHTGQRTYSNGGADSDKAQVPADLKVAKEAMRDALGPLGLWDEKKFGLWAVLYCSY